MLYLCLYWQAYYKPTGETMVVKCNKKNQGKMLREVELMRRLGDHPNIIKFKGGCVDGFVKVKQIMNITVNSKSICNRGKVYSLAEYMNGGTLEQLLTAVDEQITWPQREKLCHDIACGMQYLHAKRYIHRDLTTKACFVDMMNSQSQISWLLFRMC